MKKLFVLACTLVLGGALSFAQTQTAPASGSTDTTKSDSKTTKKSKKHKSSKKHKKGAASTESGTAAQPK
jgi:hypothetical protein